MRLIKPIEGIQTRPIAPVGGEKYISQGFNTVWIADRDMVVNGVQLRKGQNVYLSLYGWVSHSGIDIVCPIGTEILAPCDGWIIESYEKSANYGYRISMLDSTETYVHTFGHLSDSLYDNITWEFGLKKYPMKRGQVIAKSGNTGFSTGPHTHWDMFRYKNGIKQDINNGHGGRIDPWQFIKESYMEFFQVGGEQTIVGKNDNGQYFELATSPELYPTVAKIFGLEGKVLPVVSRAEVDANKIGQAKAGITFSL